MKKEKTKKIQVIKLNEYTSHIQLLKQYMFKNSPTEDIIYKLSYNEKPATNTLKKPFNPSKNVLQNDINELINTFLEKSDSFPECWKTDNQPLEALIKEFHDSVYIVNEYNLDKIINQVKQYAVEAKLDSTTAVTLIQNTKMGLIKFILYHKFYCNTKKLVDIANQEIMLLNLEYHLKDESLRVLSPQKYTNFLTMIRKGIEAYYLDIKAHPIIGNKFKISIQLFFNALLERINEISAQYATELETKPKLLEIQQTAFPSHIFSNANSYENYKQMENKTKTAEDIGFLFRHLSEKQNPPAIITTETKFRKWYNDQPDLKIILKTPIKTYNAIGGKDKKANILLLSPP